MSSKEVRSKIQGLQSLIKESNKSYSQIDLEQILTAYGALLESYGSLKGGAEAKYPMYQEIIEAKNEEIKGNTETISIIKTKPLSFRKEMSLLLIDRAIQRMSEFISFMDILETNPPKDLILKEDYNRVAKKSDEHKAVANAFTKAGFLPILQKLIEEVKGLGLDVDEEWVISVCAINLLEAGVNKKLEDLGEKTEGSFIDRLNRLIEIERTKEKKEVPQLLVEAFYRVIRNKLDNAGLKYHPTPSEANMVANHVLEFLGILFDKS